MNKFEISFFKKYTPEGQIIKGVIHEHWVRIIYTLILWLMLWVIIPSFLYYNSILLRQNIPFFIFEVYLIFLYIKIIYEIFNWYNDVWIITNEAVVDLDWALFKTRMTTVNYENIEWIEVEQSWVWDKILNKWDVVIHKIWDDTFKLEDAVIPYKTVDEIERISKECSEWSENAKFDMIMDALGWVVENYLRTNKEIEEACRIDEQRIKNFKKKKWTIDLSDIEL